MGRRRSMSIAFRRVTIDIAVVFRNKENELVEEDCVINLQTICAESSQTSVPNQRRFWT